MGNLQASEMARLTDLDSALRWHLTSNHYPPVPESMVEPCKAAIAAYLEEDYTRQIEMPAGVSYKGLTMAPASAIVEQHHLGAFIQHAAEGHDDDYESPVDGSEDLDDEDENGDDEDFDKDIDENGDGEDDDDPDSWRDNANEYLEEDGDYKDLDNE